MRTQSLLRAALAAALLTGAVCSAATAHDLAAQFDARYEAWKAYLRRPEVMVQSVAGARFASPEFRAIVELGPQALPLIAAEMKRNNDETLLWKAMQEITKVRLRSSYDPSKDRVVYEDFPDSDPRRDDPYLRWWYEGRRQTPERFAALYADWKTLKAEGKDKEAAEKYERIKDLGIDVLPLIVKQVRGGNTDLIHIMSYLSDNECPATATADQCVSWWEANKAKWTLPPAEAPKAPTP